MDVVAPLLILAAMLGGIIFWIWSIIDCATNEPNEGNSKIVWILVIALLGVLGSLIYLFVRRGERESERLLKVRRSGRISDQYGDLPLGPR
jgi:membrane protein implicated in regulation of membrane protease activity